MPQTTPMITPDLCVETGRPQSHNLTKWYISVEAAPNLFERSRALVEPVLTCVEPAQAWSTFFPNLAERAPTLSENAPNRVEHSKIAQK